MGSSKIKVFILGRDKMNWSIDSDRKNSISLFKEGNDFEVVEKILKADLIYSVWYNVLERPWFYYPLLILKKIKKIKIFAVITNNIQNTPKKVNKLDKIIDTWVSPNQKTYEFIKQNNCHTVLVPFLIDQNNFTKISEPKKYLANRLGIDFKDVENKILIGSFQRDSLGSDLSKPKWQKNPDLLISILQKIPKEKVILLLAGPRRHYLINKCKELDIPYLFIGDESFINNNKDDASVNNISADKINLLYNLIDFYLVTSKSEGGPKAILEAATTETLIFSTDVGLAKDVLHENLIYSEQKADILVKKISDFIANEDIFSNEVSFNKENVSNMLNKPRIIKIIKDAYKN